MVQCNCNDSCFLFIKYILSVIMCSICLYIHDGIYVHIIYNIKKVLSSILSETERARVRRAVCLSQKLYSISNTIKMN